MKRENTPLKQGQITLFLIIGLLILVLVFLLVVFGDNFFSGFLSQSPLTVETFVSHCIEETATDALLLLGVQGNFVELPEDTVHTSFIHAGKTPLLSETEIKDQLSSYISEQSVSCFKNFSIFRQEGMHVSTRDMRHVITLGDDSVTIKTLFPVKVTRLNTTTSFEEFYAEVPIGYKEVYDGGAEVVRRTNDYVDVSFLAQQDFDFDVMNVQGSYVYVVTDENSQVQGTPYKDLLALGR